MNNSGKIVIVEPSTMLALGLAQFFGDLARVTVSAIIEGVDTLQEKILRYNPDILIINPVLLQHSEKESLRQINEKFPNLNVMALVSSFVGEDILKSYSGIIEITDSKQKVISKVLKALDNKRVSVSQASSGTIGLSRRETDILVAVAKGLTNKEISEQLNISVHTVITHRKNITRKTNIKSVSGLTVYALLNNLVDENEIVER